MPNQQPSPTAHQPVHQRLLGLVRQSAKPLSLDTDRFFFLRHGETDGNRQRIIQPVSQPLNENGFEQATRAAELLVPHSLERIVASDLERCRQTSGVVSRKTGAELSFTPELREKSFGDWVGQSSAELDWDTPPPNGETLAAFIVRTRMGLQNALSGSKARLVVAHGGTLYVLAGGLGISVTAALLTNATPLLFERRNGAWHAEILAVVGDVAASVPS